MVVDSATSEPMKVRAVPNILTLMLLDEVTMNIDCSKWLDMVVNCEVVSVETLMVKMVVVGLQYMESMQCNEGADNLMPTTVLVTQSGGGHVMVTISGAGHVMVILSGAGHVMVILSGAGHVMVILSGACDVLVTQPGVFCHGT